jgi:hypothetical protein
VPSFLDTMGSILGFLYNYMQYWYSIVATFVYCLLFSINLLAAQKAEVLSWTIISLSCRILIYEG